jgi:hypothetical protein
MNEEIKYNPALDPGHQNTVTIEMSKEEIAMSPRDRMVVEHLDGIQHGIDDDPNDDPAKGAGLGAVGGLAVGVAAGAMLGPAGAVVGGIVGATVGAVASGLAVMGVDEIDNDNNVTGLGTKVDTDLSQMPPDRVLAIVSDEPNTR